MHITVFVFIILLRFDDVHAIFILANHPRHGHYTKFKSLRQFSVMQWTFFLHVLRFTFIIRSKKKNMICLKGTSINLIKFLVEFFFYFGDYRQEICLVCWCYERKMHICLYLRVHVCSFQTLVLVYNLFWMQMKWALFR